jgi:KipI family sensor histidine kinase inhibitor
MTSGRARDTLDDAALLGDAGLLVSAPDPEVARRWAERWRQLGLPGVVDVVGGLRSVVVSFDPEVTESGAVAEALARAPAGAGSPPPANQLDVPVHFGGPDLAEVAELLGITPAEVVRGLCGRPLGVAMVGFSPGFAYLEGLPEGWERVGRRASPRPVVPKGSVAMAAGFAAVYPQATPGGWQLLGQTTLSLFDPRVPPYARLRPGDTVVFGAVDADHPSEPGGKVDPPGGAEGGPAGVPALFGVEAPGVLTTVQDAGRTGFAHLGVPRAGAADPYAYALGNHLVGNPTGAAALEVTAQGPALRFRRRAYVAVTGEVGVTLDGRPVDTGRLVPVAGGQRLVIGVVTGGLRAYLCVAGGLTAPSVMGSCSSDTLSGLGPPPLAAGQELAGADPCGPLGDHLAPSLLSGSGRPRRLRVMAGPQAAWLAEGLDRLAETTFTVDAESNRVGVRLRPDGPPLARARGEVGSAGAVWGAVQLPSSGDPVVLGPDHATLGGYPVVAVVISADLPALGQCRPGEEVRLVPVDLAGARAARRDRPSPRQAVVGRYPVVSSERA